MSPIQEHLKRHRRQIIEREEAVIRELLTEYDQLEKELTNAYRGLAKKIAVAQAAGETISPSWFYRERRLKLLLEQVQQEVVRFGGRVTPIVIREKRAAIKIAVDQTNEIVRLISAGEMPDIGTLFNSRAVENAVGMMGDGSPIMSYYEEQLAPAVAERIKREVIKAAAVGTDFATIARRLTEAGKIPRHRALTMARTEVNRVRRETKRQIYEEHSDVFSGWEWVASHSVRTCAACLAQDGKVYKLQVDFPQHMSCRCDIIPVSIKFPRPPRLLGSEWFAGQPDAVKAKIITDAGLESYKRRDVELADFVGFSTHKVFGKSVHRRSVADALKNSVLDDAKIYEGALKKAGFATTRIQTKGTTNYILAQRGGKTAKIRVSDHDPRGDRRGGNLLELKPGTRRSGEEVVEAVEEFMQR